MMLKVTIFSGIVLSAVSVFGQNVGINNNGANPNNSAMLDVVSSNKGILIPRVQLSATNSPAPITSPATSLLIYNIAAAGGGTTAVTPGYYYNAGTSGAPNWKRVSTDGDHWRTDGNAGTLAGTNFLGTTDGQALDFRTNNSIRFRVANGNQVYAMSDGTAALPFYSWNSDANTGIYRAGTDLIGMSTVGVERFRIDNSYQVQAMGDGTAALPFYSWNSDANTGMWRSTADNLSISAGGTETMRSNTTVTSFMQEIQTRETNANAGDILVRMYDSGDDGVIDVYQNGTYNHRIHGNGVTIFNEQGIATNDFRIESDAQANMFFIDAGSNEIGIRTAAPSSMFHMINGGVNVGANSMASFENSGTDGVSISGYNTGTTNGYNAIEGIVSNSGSSFNATGVFGLAISNVFSNTSVGVRGTINGQSGIGVLGTRTNGGGAGWAGLFIEDLGYTGFFGAASDENLKKNITPINGALQIVEQLNPVTYDFDLEKNPGMGLNKEMEYGFIAQEVQKILPEIVREKNLPTNANQELKANEAQNLELEKFMVMDYTRIIPILTKAVQEQQTIIQTQNSRIDALEEVILELQKEINK